MINWNYDPSQYEEKDFGILAPGEYRVRIEEAVSKTSRNGNEMFEITLAVSGKNSKLWYYLVMMPSNPQMTNQKIGSFFASFGITDSNLNNYGQWVGKVGAVKVIHEVGNDGEARAKIQYLIDKKRAEKLPGWVEPSNSSFNAQKSPVEDLGVEIPF